VTALVQFGEGVLALVLGVPTWLLIWPAYSRDDIGHDNYSRFAMSVLGLSGLAITLISSSLLALAAAGAAESLLLGYLLWVRHKVRKASMHTDTPKEPDDTDLTQS
jgi:hypothetical protein